MKLLRVLKGERFDTPPLWMMRQAGRYLPEYKALRAQAGSFLKLCFNPTWAAEVTLQPLKRFDLDGAILFSDILVIPMALGQALTFAEGEGPRLGEMGKLHYKAEILNPIYETIAKTKAGLPKGVTLLGFCGAPFTVASYMIAGKGGDEQEAIRLMAYRQPEELKALINLLVEVSIDYLVKQFQAGVDAVQIFDSWAGILSPALLDWLCIEPTKQMIEGVRAQIPDAPIIIFPRGVTVQLPLFLAAKPNAIGLDWRADASFVREKLQLLCAVQGNIDPLALLAGGKALEHAVHQAKSDFAGGKYIFNLGHGISQHTPISHVEDLIKFVKNDLS